MLHELAEQTDRGLGVLGGALVDDSLKRAITCLWRTPTTDTEKQAFNDLAGEGGVLTFGVRIKLAYLSRLIGPTVQHDLKIVNKLRNKFAHLVQVQDSRRTPSQLTFDTEFVTSGCNSLTLVKEVPVIFNGSQLPIDKPRQKYLAATMMLFAMFDIYSNNPEKKVKFIDTILKH